MFDAIKAYFTLRWYPERKFHPLPTNVTRHFVQTPQGELELLIAEPDKNATFSRTSRQNPPIFFMHGGFGHASVWLEWMSYLSTTYNARTYACSLRNHGASYSIPFFRMVWRESFDDLASDMVACVQHARSLEKMDPILVGHSSGGGMSQYVLSKSMVKASGLALVGAIPHYGNMVAYVNWFNRADGWFGLRGPCHLYHPRSPLNNDKLVYNAFFGPEYPTSRVAEFSKWMPNYESMWWVFGMGGNGWSFAPSKRTWLDPLDIIKNISGWNASVRFPAEKGTAHRDQAIQDKIAIIMGSEDKLLAGSETRSIQEYSEAIAQKFPTTTPVPSKTEKMDKYVTETKGNGTGIRLIEVLNAGHHTQNDVQWKEAAEALRRFAEQV